MRTIAVTAAALALALPSVASAQSPTDTYSHDFATYASRAVAEQTAQFIGGSAVSLTPVKLSANRKAWCAKAVIRTRTKTMRVYIQVNRATGALSERTETTVAGVATLRQS